MKLFFKRLTVLLISSLLFLFTFSEAVLVWSDDSEENKTKTVLILESDSYGYIQMVNNKYSGYYVDYLNELSMHTGWNYDYLIADDNEFKDHLEKGDYDLVAGIINDKKYSDELSFSNQPMGIKKYSLSVRKDNPEIILENYQSMNGMNIGISKEDVEFEKSFKQFLKQNNIKYKNDSKLKVKDGVNLIHIDGDKNEQLLKGSFDGILCTNENAYKYDLFSAISFNTVPIYLAVQKGDYDSLKVIENAQAEIYSSNSNFITDLYNNSFSDIYKTNLTFSEKEKTFLDKKHVYNVALLKDKAPYSYIDDNEAFGLVVETFNKISEMTSYMIMFKYKFYDTYYEAQNAVMNGHCDIVGLSLSTSPADRNCIKNTSKVFFEDVYYYYKNTHTTESIENGVFAIHKNVPNEFLEKIGINKDNVIYVDSTMECFEYVDSGKADYTLALYNIGDFYVKSKSFNNVVVIDKNAAANSFAAGFSKNINQTMIEIFDKCLSHIDDEFYDNYLVSYMFSEAVDKSLSSTVFDNKIFISVFAVGFVILIIVLFILIFKVVELRKKGKERLCFSMNLLDKINGMVQSLSVLSVMINENNDGNIDKEAYIKKIEETSKSLSNIIENSQKLTRIRYNDFDIKQGSFWLKDLTDDLISDISDFADKYKINVTCIIDKDVPGVLVGDRQCLYEVLFNLLLNAVKYNRDYGNVRLNISLSEPLYKNYVSVLFSVEDSGIGIHEENLKKIFNPFFREDRIGINNISGAGIGLAVSKYYVEKMGGTIKAESSINVGSCFYFNLKFKLTNESNKVDEIYELKTAYDLSGKKYLIVNGNKLESEVTDCLFESVNAESVCVTSGEEAYDVFSESEVGYFDGIIIKIDLHDEECFDTVKKIRNLNRKDSKNVVIVGVFDNLSDKSKKRAVECGVDECINDDADNSKLLDIFERENRK